VSKDFNYQYDWSITGTFDCILAYLQARNLDCDGIHFKGEGWYSGDKDTLLIIQEEGRWRLYGWENRDPRPLFKQLLDLENFDD
jgi:hypothetical protein